ncbi:MAG: C45 family peptidase [Erythrobacter sp.]|jgi:isopenicillin-N N-acyltransferase-like protein|nr:C45 family peptidase [Erythrobacter sp.]
MSLTLPQLTVTGSPGEMGRHYGAHFRELIAAFVDARVHAVETYLNERGHQGSEALFAAGAACLEQTRAFDPAGHAEHLGIAEGCGIDPVRLFTTANMTDIRDILLLADEAPPAEDEGCTAALIPPALTASGRALQGQTWDLNGPDVEYVVALHRLPDEGPETWSVTCAGCQTLMGMNQHGIAVGTTNLKTRGARVGIPYLSVLHRAIRAATLTEASAVIERAPVAGAHSYWAADEREAIEWERSPQSAHRRSTADGTVVRSNHCLFPENVARETDLSPSTHQRFERIGKLVAASEAHTLESLKAMFADRSDGPMSINRFAEDASGATTNAVVAMNPAGLEFHACRGPASLGEWTRLEFERQPARAA